MEEILQQRSVQSAAWLLLGLFTQMHSEKVEQKVEFELMKKRALQAGEEEGTLGWKEL